MKCVRTRYKSSLLLLVSVFLNTTAFAGTEWDCSKLMEVFHEQPLADTLVDFSKIDDAVIAGRRVPAWNDFDTLQKLIDYYRTHTTNRKEQGLADQLETEIQGFENLLLNQFGFNPNYTHIAPFSDQGDYKPGNFELITLYRYYLNRFNDLLPLNLRMSFNPIPNPAISRQQYIDQAIGIIARQKERVTRSLNLLHPSLTSWDEFKALNETWVQSQQSPSTIPQLYNTMLDSKNIQLSMRRPENGRFWIPKVGFQNLRVTHSSKGTGDSDLTNYTDDVNEFESRALGMKKNDYVNLHDDVKPNYGFMQFSDETQFRISMGLSAYGEDVYIFNYEKVKNRTTFVLGDSLLGVPESKGLVVGRTFTPVEYLPYTISAWSAAENNAAVGNKFQSYPTSEDYQFSGGYIEVQYFGPLFLDLVDTFIFTNNPPSGEFLTELHARGIKILDGRNDVNHPIPWEMTPTQTLNTKINGTSGENPLSIPTMVETSEFEPGNSLEADINAITSYISGTSFQDYFGNYQTGILQSPLMMLGQQSYFVRNIPHQSWGMFKNDYIVLPVSIGMRSSDLSNEKVYEYVSARVDSMTLVQYIQNNDYILDSNHFYHFATSAEEASQWRTQGTLPKETEWTPSLYRLLNQMGRKPGQLRLLLSQKNPILAGQNLQANIIELHQKAQVAVHSTLDNEATDLILNGNTINNVNVLARNYSLSYTIYPGAYENLSSGSNTAIITANDLYEEIMRNTMNYYQEQKLFPNQKEGMLLDDYNNKFQRITQEQNLVQLLINKGSISDVQAVLDALGDGPCEVDRYDSAETLVSLAKAYIAGTFTP